MKKLILFVALLILFCGISFAKQDDKGKVLTSSKVAAAAEVKPESKAKPYIPPAPKTATLQPRNGKTVSVPDTGYVQKKLPPPDVNNK